jgi:putative transposase
MCKLIFNTLLRLVFDNYSTYRSTLEYCSNNNIPFDKFTFNLSHKLPKISTLKKSDDRFKLVDSLAICAEYSNLVRGMQLFYAGHSARPKFKSRNDKHSYTTSMVNNNIRLSGNKIRLPKLGFIKIRGLRYIPCNFKIKRAIVFENKAGKFFISIIFEYPSNKKISSKTNFSNNKVVGLDFKIGDIFVSSDKFIPHYSYNYFYLLDKLPFIQHIVNRKLKFSKNYWKSINKLRHFHRKIVNIRNDFLNKLSTFIAKNYQYIVIENLSIKEIVSKLGRGKNAYNTCFNSFVKKLNYKSNGDVIKIDKWFPSSKKCSCCGKKKKHLKLSQRIYHCAFCGNIIDRDLNAAINIKNEGIRLLENM